jgi:hypothetical protein
MSAPRRRQLAALLRTEHQHHGRDDEEPSRKVEEAIGERVVLQADDRGARVVTGVGKHVMPLKDLMEHDPVDETAESQAPDERRRFRRIGGGRVHH